MSDETKSLDRKSHHKTSERGRLGGKGATSDAHRELEEHQTAEVAEESRQDGSSRSHKKRANLKLEKLFNEFDWEPIDPVATDEVTEETSADDIEIQPTETQLEPPSNDFLQDEKIERIAATDSPTPAGTSEDESLLTQDSPPIPAPDLFKRGKKFPEAEHKGSTSRLIPGKETPFVEAPGEGSEISKPMEQGIEETSSPPSQSERIDQPGTSPDSGSYAGVLPSDARIPSRLKDKSGDGVSASQVAQSLLLDILEEDPERLWSEDELLLAEQVTDQLSLALENARLHQETRRQLQEQVALRQASVALSSSLEIENILKNLAEQMCVAIDATSAYISDYDPQTTAAKVLAEYISPEASPLERQSDVGETFIDEEDVITKGLMAAGQHKISHFDNPALTRREREHMEHFGAKSILYIPLIIQGQVIGLSEVWESRRKREFSPQEINLCEDISRQAAVAIERARLFEETTRARDALEVSERYQKSIAQAVSVLTERGMAALSEVLKVLGEAAKASRAYYFETQVDYRGAYWRLIAEWCNKDVPGQLNNPTLRRLPVNSLLPWLEQLRSKGHVSAITSASQPEIREFFEGLGTRSVLQFAVAGRHEIPGCIGFEQIDYERQWAEDEIAALKTAASALENTLSREDLFTQVQLNLAETEAMYQASARLNAAADYTEILDVLRQHTILGHVNASNVSLYLFDRIWTISDIPETLIPIASWKAKPGSQDSSEVQAIGPYRLAEWQDAESLLLPERPIVVLDTANDARFFEENRQPEFISELQAKSLVCIPLNVAGRWIGHIIAAYQQSVGFPEGDIRRLNSLSGQAAVAIESLRLLEETRRRNEELAAINQITSAASRSLELDEVLSEILRHILSTTQYDCGLISLADPATRRLHLAVHERLPAKMVDKLAEAGLDGTSCDLVYQSQKTIYIPDMNVLPEKDLPWEPRAVHQAFEGPRSLGFASYLGVPLESKGIVLGTVCVFNRTPRTVTLSRLRLIQAAGRQVGTVVDNARLFQSTQLALSETETLYQASAELNSAQTFDDLLRTLRKYTILGDVDHAISLDLFQRAWIGENRPENAAVAAHWDVYGEDSRDLLGPPERKRFGTGGLRPIDGFKESDTGSFRPFQELISEVEDADVNQLSLYLLSDFPAAHHILRADEIVTIEDIYNDPRLDEKTLAYYESRTSSKGKSLIFVPLVVGGLWIGFVHAVYNTPAKIKDYDIRRLEVLASQAAVAAQNLRQVEQIQLRAQYEYITREISSQVSSTIDHDTILRTTARSLSQALNASHVHIRYDKGNIGYLFDHETDRFIPANDLESVKGLSEKILTRRVTPGNVIELPAPGDPRNSGADWSAMDLSDSVRHLSTPIILRGEVIGKIQVADATDTIEWTENDTVLLQTIASQAALSLDNARLFQSTQTSLSETESLYQASAELNEVQSYDDILQTLRKYTVLGQADKLLNISLFDRPWAGIEDSDMPEWVTPIAHWTVLPAEKLKRRYSLREFEAAKLLSPAEPAIFTDVQEDVRLDEGTRQLLREDFEARSAIFVPLVVGGQWVGYINGCYSLQSHFDESEIRRTLAMAGQSAVAIQNLRLLEESQRRANQLQTAAEIARDTTSTLALDAMLQSSVNLICERFGYYHASIFLVDESRTYAVIQESTGAAGAEMKRRGHRLQVGSRSIIGQVTATGEHLVVNDIAQEGEDSIHKPNPLLPNTQAELGIPLKIGDQVIGAVDVQATNPDAFSEDDISVLQILSDQIAVAVDNLRSYELAQKAVEEIREADRLKSQFLANMSHELRTPLNSIIGFSRVILKGIDGPISDLQEQDLTAIYNSGQHLLGLINDVLDLSKIEAGKMDLAFEDNVILTDIIKGVMSTTVGLVKDKPIQLRQEIDDDLPALRIDPMKIRQVMLNLLSNAAKFTEEGSIAVEATTQTGPEDAPEVIVRIIDTGPGIAPEDQVNLFQPFSQVDGSLTRKTGGSGLGLSISHHLVRMHGGRIGLKSKLGAGTTFYFTLPINGPEHPFEPDQGGHLELPDVQSVKDKPRTGSTDELRRLGIAVAPPSSHSDGQVFPIPHDGEQTPLPEHDPDAPSYPAADLQPPEHGVSSQARTNFVLAVDEDPEVINRYRQYLSAHNYSVIALTKLDQVLTVARSVQPFAITLDVTMGAGSEGQSQQGDASTLDGWQVLEALGSDPTTNQIPIIVCTVVDQRERAINLGASGYLLKPILEEDLSLAISRLPK